MKRIFSLMLAFVAVQIVFAAKIQVTNTSGDPTVEGSLPWACETGTSSDTIVFKFSTSGKKVINITSSLYPYASIDGSTCADSIIVDGKLGNGNLLSFGLTNTGPLVKGIVIQNCSTAIHSNYNNCEIIDCVIRENRIGVHIGNGIKRMSGCLISGNDSVGVLVQADLKLFSNNIVGLTADQRSPYPNGIGVLITSGSILDFNNCVVSGNRKNGIEDNSRLGISSFNENYIGTNKYFDNDQRLGNGGHGYIPSGSASINDFSNNYFGNNGGYGLFREFYSGSSVLKNSYFGVSPDGKSMPNRKGGLNFGSYPLTLENCYVSNNGGDGITYNNAALTIVGGEFSLNAGHGINYKYSNPNQLVVENVTFNYNQYSPIYVATAVPYTSRITNNKFLNTYTDTAFAVGKYPTPEITSCKMNANNVTLTGKVDTAAKAKIELYLTTQYEQTATMFVDSFYTDADGTFSVSVPKSKVAGMDSSSSLPQPPTAARILPDCPHLPRRQAMPRLV